MSDAYEVPEGFDSDDPEFARGFEAGLMYACLAAEQANGTEPVVSFPIHDTNMEMALRIAEMTGFSAKLVSESDEWVRLDFERKPA